MNEGPSELHSAIPSPAPIINPDLDPKISVKDLNFYYQTGYHALKNINLSVADRCVTAFIGPSGCGKSTLLRVLNRIYDLYPGQRAVGEVLVDGENILAPGYDVTRLRAKVGDGVSRSRRRFP